MMTKLGGLLASAFASPPALAVVHSPETQQEISSKRANDMGGVLVGSVTGRQPLSTHGRSIATAYRVLRPLACARGWWANVLDVLRSCGRTNGELRTENGEP